MLRVVVSVLMVLTCLTSIVVSETRKDDSLLGNKVEDFTLRSHLGREWSLADFADKQIIVVTFLGTECPLAKLYGRRLAELSEKYSERGVAFIGINANTQDSMTELTAYANRHEIEFPLLKDIRNQVADAVGAQRTPEVFVLDRNRRIRYHGRIDDQYAVGVSRDQVNRQDLAEAVDELLVGKKVSVGETQVVGCFIGRVKHRVATGDVTYSKQIVRILNSRCVECHRDGEIAPFPLTSYDDIIGWEDTIVEVIQDQRMPPWFANPDHGKFHNDARLTQEEKELICKWVENGMPKGDPVDMPPVPEFSKGWRIPKPDQVLHMRETAFTVPAQGVVDYKHFVVDPGWDEDKYIYAAEARPDNMSVVHHILVYIIPGDGRGKANLRRVLVGYAPGSTPVELKDGVAIHVPAGSKLLFQMHYTPNGYEQSDRSYAGVCFTEESKVKKKLQGRLAINERLRIPAFEGNHIVKSDFEFSRDEMLISMTPHMHLRGKSFRYEAEFPGGEREVLLDVPAYDFNWQLKYILDKPKLMPKGTKVMCTATYDNSERNLANPDPSKAVRWGDQSWEEMMIGFFDTIPADQPSESDNQGVPNIVLILADDMGYGDVTFLNPDSRIPTPNLDRLASGSLIFTDAHSGGSYCVPSRYGLLTGRYMWRGRLGSGGNLANFGGTLIEPGRKTLADLLHDEGYFTGLVGKWHQGIDWKLRDESAREVIRVDRNYQDFRNINFAAPVLKGPNDYGFDYSFATAGSAEMNPSTFIENNRVVDIPTLSSQAAKEKYGEWYGRDDNIIADGHTMDRLVPTLSTKACEFVEMATRTKPGQPFFLYYAMTTPHNPIVPNREFVGTSRAGAYGDFVVELDHHVGKILHKIAELGIERNTIVIFTSDNGPVDRTNGYQARWVRGDVGIYGHDSNGPFQGWKAGLQEGGHRVPFFVRWPDKIKTGGSCATTIIFNDVVPTLAEMLNINLDNHTAEDGHSFFKAMTGEASPESFHEAIVHNHSNGTFAIRKGAFKLTVDGPKTTEQVVDDSFPVSLVLHDLGNDIEETTDVSSNHPALVQEMHTLLKKYVREGSSNGRR